MTRKTARTVRAFFIAIAVAAIAIRITAPEPVPVRPSYESTAPAASAQDDEWWLEPPNAPAMSESSN